MGQAARDTYLAGVDPQAVPAMTTVDEAIRAACPELDVGIKYGLLTYGLNGDRRRWVCSIGATKRGVALRFLYGVLLDDPRGVLRAGSSVLMTWDLGLDEEVDAPEGRPLTAQSRKLWSPNRGCGHGATRKNHDSEEELPPRTWSG